MKMISKRAKRAIIGSQRARPFGTLRLLRAGSFARLARIPRQARDKLFTAKRTLVQDDKSNCELSIPQVASVGRLRSRPRSDSFFSLRANQNVRAKERAVNSVFLVQLRKMFATDLCGSARTKNFFGGVAVSRVEGAGSICGKAREGKFARTRRLIVHRGCTGNAERHWSVVSDQWPVVLAGYDSLGLVGQPRRAVPT